MLKSGATASCKAAAVRMRSPAPRALDTETDQCQPEKTLIIIYDSKSCVYRGYREVVRAIISYLQPRFGRLALLNKAGKLILRSLFVAMACCQQQKFLLRRKLTVRRPLCRSDVQRSIA
jgi:hypothetical protein